jgi:ectoine hydroxylase-related dioxygenase (phytanoyl-CoA dioxygenase family)
MPAEQHRQVTADEISSYQRDGVVCLRQIVAVDDIQSLATAIDQAVHTLGASPSGYDLTRIRKAVEAEDLQSLMKESGGQYNVVGLAAAAISSKLPMLVDNGEPDAGQGGRFLLDTGVAARIVSFREFTLYGPGGAIAAALMGSTSVNFYDDQIFVKEAGTRERTAYHQDGSYFHLEGDQICTLWIPVDPVESAFSVRYVRGSHRWGKTYKPNVFLSQMSFPGAEGETLPDIDGHEKDYDIVSFDLDPGDVVVHHHLTVHGAPGNTGPRLRRAAGVRYCGDDVRYRHRPFAPAQLHHKHTLRDGDPICCEQFPNVWPTVRERHQAA